MKVIFFGSTKYSLVILKKLQELNQNIVLVVTTPPRRKGRGMQLLPSVVETFCKNENLEYITPENPDEGNSFNLLKKKEPDLFIVVEYGKIFSPQTLELPRVLPINIHPSLLPKYRGASPVNWQIINGERVSGVTFHKITPVVDRGPILFQEAIDVYEDDNSITLHERLINLSADSLGKVLTAIKDNKITLTPQDESLATYSPKLTKEQGRIQWSLPAGIIERYVRGFLPWPTAYGYFKGQMIKFYRARSRTDEKRRNNLPPGQIMEVKKNSFSIQCGKGYIEIWELQPAGKKVMSTREFICGYRITSEDCFE